MKKCSFCTDSKRVVEIKYLRHNYKLNTFNAKFLYDSLRLNLPHTHNNVCNFMRTVKENVHWSKAKEQKSLGCVLISSLAFFITCSYVAVLFKAHSRFSVSQQASLVSLQIMLFYLYIQTDALISKKKKILLKSLCISYSRDC